MNLKTILSDVILVCGGIFCLSVLTLATALVSQFVFGLEPCTLCHYQRVPYAITAVLALIGLIVAIEPERMKISAFLIFLCSPIFLAGAAVAFYHVGVEQHWWTSFLEGCAVDLGVPSGQDLLKMIESKPAPRCDQIAWQDPIIGVSMAGYNVIVSLALAAGSLAGSIFVTRRANGF